jgi:hypothetical protein
MDGTVSTDFFAVDSFFFTGMEMIETPLKMPCSGNSQGFMRSFSPQLFSGSEFLIISTGYLAEFHETMLGVPECNSGIVTAMYFTLPDSDVSGIFTCGHNTNVM